MIHVCYGLYDRDGHYSKFVGTSMLSLFENTNEQVMIHILHDNTLNFDNRDKFTTLANKYNQQVQFYNVEVLAADDIANINNHLIGNKYYRYSIASLYRLFIPQLINKSIGKIIYLDADIIVNCNISNLWDINLGEYPLAAVPEFSNGIKYSVDKYMITSGEVEGENYLNSGVLLLNLDKIRTDETFVGGGYIDYLKNHPQCKYLDQDILNYNFSTKYLKLPIDFNRFVDVERLLRKPCAIKKSIYHFLSNSFQADTNDVFNRMYLEYFMKTPWFNIDMLSNIFKAATAEHDNQLMNIINMSVIIAKHRRAFYVTENNITAVKQIFAVLDNELLIDASKPKAEELLINKMSKVKGKVMLFVFANNYKAVRNLLIKEGFAENADFINGLTLLSTKYGFSYNPNYIIRQM